MDLEKKVRKLKLEQIEMVKKIFSKYGEEEQALKSIEELAELQRAIARKDLRNMEEEIADVFIMLNQLLLFQGINKKKVLDLIDYKLKRQLERIKEV